MCFMGRMLLRKLILASCLALSTVFAVGCAGDDAIDDDSSDSAEEPLTRVSSDQEASAQREEITGLTFDHLTPTTTRMMRASRFWMHEQDKESRYPRPRMCASNVSKVLFMSGIKSYDQEGVRNLLSDFSRAGAKTFKLPRTRAELAAKLQSIDNGHIPAGTIVAGLNVRTSAPGDQHIGMIGHTDPDGTIWVYHNNWYRPENEGGQRKPYMISDANLRRGYLRQWMATPWVRVTRDASGKITDAVSLLPAVDDMDPMNAQFQVTMMILPEVVRELAE